jgi:hypothetical protein
MVAGHDISLFPARLRHFHAGGCCLCGVLHEPMTVLLLLARSLSVRRYRDCRVGVHAEYLSASVVVIEPVFILRGMQVA